MKRWIFSSILEISGTKSFRHSVAICIKTSRNFVIVWKSSWNSDITSISSTLGRQSAEFTETAQIWNHIIVHSSKHLDDFRWNFEVWAVQKVCESGRSRTVLKMRLSLSEASIQPRTSLHQKFWGALKCFLIHSLMAICLAQQPGLHSTFSLRIVVSFDWTASSTSKSKLTCPQIDLRMCVSPVPSLDGPMRCIAGAHAVK